MTTAPARGFVPPPYPYERLDALQAIAAASPVGLVDCSIGTPCDPVPDVVAAAARAAIASSMGYPASAGSAALREAAASWIGRRFGVTVEPPHLGACVGTKEFVVSLPHALRLRRPDRDTVLYPAVAYPSYEMGATLAGCRAVPVALDAHWHLDLTSVREEDAARALLLWCNEPGNPSSSVASRAHFDVLASWARERGITVASDECYVEFAPEPETILSSGLDGMLAVHSLSKRSNAAGFRVGFYAGDPELVDYLVEVRKHAGFMVPSLVQSAAVAALGDDAHVAAQRERYESRRDVVAQRLARHGLEHAGGPMAFYLWLRDPAGGPDGRPGWDIAARLAPSGLLVSPGEFYGAAGDAYVRLALVQPLERLQAALDQFDNLEGVTT
jgi:succinyldiaminopimelate transaminase